MLIVTIASFAILLPGFRPINCIFLITIVVLWLRPKLLFLYCILYSSFNKVPTGHLALV